MDDTKQWWKSKIFWAAVVTVATGLGGLLTGDASLEEAAISILGALIAIFRLFFTEKILTV